MAYYSDPNALKAGATIAGYEILRVIGAGGFGITYEAKSPVTGRHVAIKEFFPRGIASRENATRIAFSQRDTDVVEWALKRFESSTTEQCRLKHPNIVSVFHYVKENDTGYMIMEYVEGQTLEHWLRDRPSPPTPEELRPLIEPIFDALAYLHSQNLIHRDIAPDNIMVRNDGRPVIIDFGAIKMIEQQTQLRSRTNRSFTVSKPYYSPPEQLQGNAEQLDARVDVYATGATIYRALAGKPPVSSEDRIQQIAFENGDPMVPLGTMAPEVPPAVAAAIDRSLAFHAKARTASIGELREALGWSDGTTSAAPAVTGATIPVTPTSAPLSDARGAPPPNPTVAPRQQMGRGWVMPVIGTAAALAAVLLLVGGLLPLNLFGSRAPVVIVNQPPPVLTREPQRIEPQIKPAPAPQQQTAPKIETTPAPVPQQQAAPKPEEAPSAPPPPQQAVPKPEAVPPPALPQQQAAPKPETPPAPPPQQQAVPEKPAPKPDPQEAARRDYELAQKVGTIEAYDQYLARYPNGYYATLARAQRNKLAAQATAELTKRLNEELRRVGCRAAGNDDEWNEASRRGLLAYNQHAATRFDAAAPSTEALDALRARPGRVCPLICAAGQRPQGDTCVTVACGRGLVRAPNGACIRPQAAPRAPVARQERPQQPRQQRKCNWGDFAKGQRPDRQYCN